MFKRLLSASFLAATISANLFAQSLVTTSVQPKNAVLEEFTGIHCGYCPQGHAIGHDILEANPGRVVVIALHQGSFASPSGGEPDYRTEWGDAIAGQTGLSGYPSGTVNRHLFSGGNTALSRGDWAGACDQMMGEDSPVNVGIESNYDDATRELTVNVELYYTGDAAEASNLINVALLQDHVFGPQAGGNAGNNYEHMHMLRHLITGQWGDEVTTTTAGSLVNRTYTYTVPEDYNGVPVVMDDINVAVFVSETHQEIITGDVVTAIGGTNLYVGGFELTGTNLAAGQIGEATLFNATATSNLEGTESFEFSLVGENAPESWNAVFVVDGTEYTSTANIDLTKDEAKDVQIKITPDAAAGFATYTLELKSTNNPNAPVQYTTVMVISNVTDLVVNAIGGPESAQNQGAYLDGLAASGIDTYAVTNSTVMVNLINASATEGIYNMYLNISWTFPAFTDEQAVALQSFMDNGGNILVAGQDIGWDIMSGHDQAHGTPVTQAFYTDYLKAEFKDDGSSANNQLTANTDDDIFGAVANSSIVDVFGGNMYPDQISALAGADQAFYYNGNASKGSVVKNETDDYRCIYFGIGLEMISDVDVRNEIISLSRAWLTGDASGIEFNDAAQALMLGQNYPNPAQSYTFIPVNNANKGARLEVLDMNGRVVKSAQMNESVLYKLNVEDLPQGLYTYRLLNGSQVSASYRLQVVK